MREKQTDEGQEAPIRPQIALTTEKSPLPSMSVRSVSSTYWYVPLQYGYRLPVLSVDASFFKSLFVWWTSKGRSTISPPGLRTATVLLLFDTSIPTAVITAASIFLTFASTSVQLKQCFVLSAHLHCSLGLGICIAHWL